MKKKKYSFNVIMDAMNIIWDVGVNKGLPVTESVNTRHNTPNMMDISRLGAEIMRLKERVEILEQKKGGKK